MAHFTDGTNDFTADKALGRTSKPRVLIQGFGDGYQQRIAAGINTLEENFAELQQRQRILILFLKIKQE